MRESAWKALCPHRPDFVVYSQGPTFRKEKTAKIIELEIDSKQKLFNDNFGLKRVNIMGDGRSQKKKPKKANGTSGAANGDESDSDSSEAMEVNGMEIDDDDDEEDEEDVDDDEDDVAKVARTASGKVKGAKGRNERLMSAGEIRSHIRILFSKQSELCMLLYGRHGSPGGTPAKQPHPSTMADMFFIDVVPVTPTRFRPPAKMGDELFEHPQNSLLIAVINTSARIRELNQRLLNAEKAERGELVLEAAEKGDSARDFGQLLESLIKLQHDVNSFMDSSKNPAPMRQGKLPPPGIKQLLEKKEGLFRKHMMVSASPFSTMMMCSWQ